MAWTLTANGGNDATGLNSTQFTSRTIVFTGAVAVGDLICVGATWDDSSGATGAVITDSLSNTYTQQAATLNASGQRSAVFACIVAHAGTPTLTLRFNPTPGTTKPEVISWLADHFTGSDASSTIDGTPAAQTQATPTTTTDLLTSGSITTTVNGDLVWSYTYDAATGGNPGSVGTGFTAAQTTASLISKSEYKVQATAGAVAGTWTAAANDLHATFAFAVKPAAPSGTTLTPSAASSTWTTPTATLTAVGTLTPSAVARSWVTPIAALVVAALTLSPTAPHATWTVPTPSFGTLSASYSTSFATNEDPLSEGNRWLLGQTDGNQWGDWKAFGGNALGKRARDVGDNTAILKGIWTADQYATAVCYVGTPSASYDPELGLRLRSALSLNINRGYEIGFSLKATGAYFIIVRWDGAYDTYTYIRVINDDAYRLVDGDVIRAEIRGNALRVYKNGTLLLPDGGTDTVADMTKNGAGTFIGDAWTDGAPGISSYALTGGDAFVDQYGFKSFDSGSLDPVTLATTPAVQTWTVPTATLSGALTLSPTAAHSTWTAQSGTLTPGSATLQPSAAASTWTVPTPLLNGATTLVPTAAVRTWNAGVATLSASAVSLTTAAATSAWTVNAPAFGAGLTLLSAAAVSSWSTPTASLNVGAIALAPLAAVRSWSVPLGRLATAPSDVVHLDEPLSIDFASRARALVFLEGGMPVLELIIMQGESEPIDGVLYGADPDNNEQVPYDVSAATSLTLTAGKPGATPIIAAKTLATTTGGADGAINFTPSTGETAMAGRYNAVVVATFSGGIIRKFPGRLTITDDPTLGG